MVSVDDCASIELPDPAGQLGDLLSGKYTPIAVIDYSPATNYGANDVLAQSIDLTFDSGLGATSLWYSTSCANPALTQLIADGATNSEDDSTKSVLSAVLSGGTSASRTVDVDRLSSPSKGRTKCIHWQLQRCTWNGWRHHHELGT